MKLQEDKQMKKRTLIDVGLMLLAEVVHLYPEKTFDITTAVRMPSVPAVAGWLKAIVSGHKRRGSSSHK